jgi:uncharacterized protein (DUF58 family)
MEATLATGDHLDDRQFQLAVRRLADSLSYGADKSPFFGSGIEFAQSRPYQAGDPVKLIDWRVTGRSGRVHVKEYEAPKRMPVYLLVDSSASMCVTSHGRSKYFWATQLAGGLALAALARMSPVGIMGCGERQFGIRSTLSRPQVFLWLKLLRRHQFDEGTQLGQRLDELAGTLENRSAIFILSDLHDPAALTALKPMAQRHDCVVLQLVDPAEKGVTGGGIFRAAEAETGRVFVTHGRQPWLDQDAITRDLRRAGVDHLPLRTDEPFIPRLQAFLRRRDRRTQEGR